MSEEKKIKVVLLEPGKLARTAEIDASLAGMQKVVGGLIEPFYPFEEQVCIVCNEESKINGMRPNRSVKNDDGVMVDSRFHGVPQNRERIYLVAYRHFRAEGVRKVFPVTAGDGKALIQLIGGTQGKRVYDPAGVSCTLMSEGGGFAGRTGMYFIDLCKGEPRLTEHARCIKARYDSGITNHSGDKSGVLCMSGECPDRTEETALIQLKRGDPKILEQDHTKCLIAGYDKIGVSNRGESSGIFYGCRAVLTPDRENKRQNGRRFKACGEPAFCLNTQDKHGVYLCACDSCEFALPVKRAKEANQSKPENGSALPLGCGRIRKLTPRECWRLQGFSDDMFDRAAAVNSDAQLYKQAGNGVTIPVVYAVGKRIAEIQNELERRTYEKTQCSHSILAG